MPTTGTEANTSRLQTNGQVATACSVCPHPWTAHDQIAVRYCAATTAGSHSRGCVCTVRSYDTTD